MGDLKIIIPINKSVIYKTELSVDGWTPIFFKKKMERKTARKCCVNPQMVKGKCSDKASEKLEAKRWLNLCNPFHLLNSLNRKALNGTSLNKNDNFIED